MGVECPKCKTENTSDSEFCKKCATPLPSPEEISSTKTLETPKEELTTGSTFASRYQIIEELGKGGMGKVYRVLDKELKEEVALKLIKPEIASDKKTLERFSNELKLARKISHKNVGRMYELMQEKGTRYITMEYVPGEDLKRLIRKVGQFSAGKTVSIAKQVCEGLAEAHRLGVVHRDLKPQNIMVDEEGDARILDFGIARSLRAKRITGAGVMIGTPEYMSPEQAEVKEVDQRSDIYSLGVILYEMVTGRVPFEGETPLGIAMKHKSEIPKDPREINAQIPEDLSKVILRCMEKDKENRYQSAGEVRSELSSIEKGIPTTEIEIPKRKPITSREITVTFGMKKLFIPALIVITLAIIGMIIWQLLPKKELPLAPKIENSIAVISFENQTGDKAFDYLQKAIPSLLITNLENIRYLHVATWERMRDLLTQIGKEDVEVIDSDLAFELCRLEGIEALIKGSFIKMGDLFATDIKVLDVETKKLLIGAKSQGEGVDSILKTQIDELSMKISQGMGLAREKIESTRLKVAEVTTSSMEAYNFFLKGREAQEFFLHDDARRFLEKAVELDTTFASAYLLLARAYHWLGNTEARDEAYKKAKNFSEKATDKERLYIEAYYASAIENNSEKYIQILAQMEKEYPKEKRVHFNLGLSYFWRKMYQEAIEEFNKAVKLDPNYGIAVVHLGYTYAVMEKYEKALEYFRNYVSLFPGEVDPLNSIGDCYFMMGRLDDALVNYKEAIRFNPDYYFCYRHLGYIYALKENYLEAVKWIDQHIAKSSSLGLRAEGHILKGFYHYWHGNFHKSIDDLDKAQDLAEEVENKDWIAIAEGMKGWIHYDRGNLDLCIKCYNNFFDFCKEFWPPYIPKNKSWYLFFLGLVDLKQERIDSAKVRLREMKSLFPKAHPPDKAWMKYLDDFLTGEVLIAEGSLEKAVVALKEILPLDVPLPQQTGLLVWYNVINHREILARAYLQKADLEKAIVGYERLTAFDPDSKDRRLINPKNHYRLAKLYEEKGWKAKAIEHYERFLDLWKDADPGIAEVEDARKRVSELKNK